MDTDTSTIAHTELLLDAAGTLRNAAHAAVPGPWQHGTAYAGIHFVFAPEVGSVTDDHVARMQAHGPNRRRAKSTGEYMALMDPRLGAALADWLAAVAAGNDDPAKALTVARLIAIGTD